MKALLETLLALDQVTKRTASTSLKPLRPGRHFNSRQRLRSPMPSA
jgi:hypothetical protein